MIATKCQQQQAIETGSNSDSITIETLAGCNQQKKVQQVDYLGIILMQFSQKLIGIYVIPLELVL